MRFIMLILGIFTFDTGFSQIPNYIPKDSLVGWWPFNGNANDESGNGNNGKLYGATLTNDRFNNSKNAYYFDGNDYIEVLQKSIFNFDTSSYTISCWATTTGNRLFHTFVVRHYATVYPNAWTDYCLRYENKGLAFIATGQSGSSVNNCIISIQTPKIDFTKWNHFAVTYNSQKSIVILYVNGQKIGSKNIKSPPISKKLPSAKLFFGVEQPLVSMPSGPNYHVGNLDDVGIWHRALDSNEIRNLFDNCKKNDLLSISIDTLHCVRDSIEIKATSGFQSYLWNTGSTDSITYAKQTGIISVEVSDSLGCISRDTTFFINPGPVSVDVLSIDSVTCYGLSDGSITTQTSGGFEPVTYSWDDPQNQNTSDATNLKSGFYNLLVSDKYGCKDSINAQVYEPDELVIFASTIQNIKCYNDSNGSISSVIKGGVEPYQYIWNNNRTTSSEIKNLLAGDYKLIVEDKNGCRDSSSIKLTNPDKLDVDIIEPIYTMTNTPVKLNARVVPVGGDYIYSWEPASIFKNESTKQNPVIVLKETQGLKVNVSTKSGCIGSDSIEMRVLQSLDEILPNAITPDGDGINDIFKPQEYFDILEFKVYNKWGQLIYDNQGSQEGWNGTFTGDVVPAGVYYYLLQVQVKHTDQLIQHSGDITIIK
jgi:gliding motility-associated-like protein